MAAPVAGEGWEGESCQQPREEGLRQLTGCDKWVASTDHTEKKKEECWRWPGQPFPEAAASSHPGLGTVEQPAKGDE